MKYGGWVPISKGFINHMPEDRPYTELEAAYSLQLDYDAGKPVTVSGYASLWKWSRRRVRRFLEEMGVTINYPGDTRKKQNQTGQIRVQIPDRSVQKNGQIRFINSRGLDAKPDRSDGKNGQIAGRSADTTRILEDPDRIPSSSGPPDEGSETNHANPQESDLFEGAVELYHKYCSGLPRVRVASDRRRKMFRARCHEKHKSESGLRSDNIKFWEGFFQYVSKSDFLMGGRNQEGWRADFEWLITKNNFIKTLEGNYHRR